VDEIGGLSRALDLAREAAGLTTTDVRVREVNPISGTINLGRLLPSPLAGLVGGKTSEAARPNMRTDPVQTFIRLMLEHQPGPLVVLPPGTVPEDQ
jgi:hypothetical protein